VDNKERARKIERLSIRSRLQDLAVHVTEGEANRLVKIYAVLEKLDPGVYLVGAGPYTQGVFSLMCDEIVIGRLATALEKALDIPVDIFVNDAVTLTPREVSRVHCMIYRRDGVTTHDYWLIDRGSSCGTFLNGEKLEAPASSSAEELARASRTLSDGDAISLGPSGINNFLFVDLQGWNQSHK
jgi:pSer/pThr/pTyr-binding forkhead associated (FHA) protein